MGLTVSTVIHVFSTELPVHKPPETASAHRGIPSVLDSILRATFEQLSDVRPSISEALMSIKQRAILRNIKWMRKVRAGRHAASQGSFSLYHYHCSVDVV